MPKSFSFWRIGVSMKPGSITITRMPQWRSSDSIASLSASSAHLLAE